MLFILVIADSKCMCMTKLPLGSNSFPKEGERHSFYIWIPFFYISFCHRTCIFGYSVIVPSEYTGCCHQSYRESKVASDVSVIHAVHLVHFLSELMIMLLYLCNMGAINLMESCGKSYYGASELYKLDN